MENSCLTTLTEDEKIIPTDSEFLKGYASLPWQMMLSQN